MIAALVLGVIGLVILLLWAWRLHRERRCLQRYGAFLRDRLADSEAAHYKADRLRWEAERALSTESAALYTVASNYRDYRYRVARWRLDVAKSLAALKVNCPL